jgi:hypothetical protein
MPAQMTDAARRQGWKSALIIVPCVLIALWGVRKLLVLACGISDTYAERLALALVWGLSLLYFFARWIYGRTVGGDVLLDCGPNPSKQAHLGMGALIGLLYLCFYPNSLSEMLTLDGSWFGISMAVFFIVAAFGRLQVRKNGIMQYWSLLRWGKFASYHWDEDSTLLVDKKCRLSLRVALSFPPEQRVAADALLARFCPAAEIT